jgi:crossover junction endodeoxyribonuclease RusA
MARAIQRVKVDRTPPLFEACVHGQAISAQSGNRPRLHTWKRQVTDVAAVVWAGREPLGGELELHVFHYAETLAGDLDNLNKPIQDALRGVAFLNDRQVKLLRGGWRDINGVYRVRYISLPLGAAFSDGRPFVHMRIWRATVTEDLD